MSLDKIVVHGAREHNLKDVDVTIPRDKLVVLTGLSGSGKSSLAFDTIYAEGQRRYVESLSSYARMFLGQMEKPDVDMIDGLSPAISIDQKTTSKNPRSTVGTVTEIYDYLRLLYARIGIPHCPICGREIKQQTIDQIVDQVLALPERTKIQVMAPVVRGRKGEHQKEFEAARKSGFVRARVDGLLYDLNEKIQLEKNRKHTIEIVVDRLVVKPDIRSRLADSIETASGLTGGIVVINVIDGEDITFSQNYACPEHGVSVDELSPRMFSFNNPYGACKKCTGLGVFMKIDPQLIIPDKRLSINKGGLKASGWAMEGSTIAAMYMRGLSEHYHFSLDTPLGELPPEIIDILLYGTKGEKIKLRRDSMYGSGSYMAPFEGVINNLERRFHDTSSNWIKEEIESYMSAVPCDACHGQRLSPESLAVTVGGLNISQFCDKSVTEALEFVDALALTDREKMIAAPILKEIKSRLGFLQSVGLEYLTLSRSSGTLSGGESQRIRLATQIGSSLMGVLYILDEPSHRPAPAGQPQAAGHPQAPAGPGQHRHRGGARRGHHAGRRLYRRRGPRGRHPRRGDRLRRAGERHREVQKVPHRPVPQRQAEGGGAGAPPPRQRQIPGGKGRRPEQPAAHRRKDPPGGVRLRHRGLRLGEILPYQRDFV